MMSCAINLTNKKFGRLAVIRRVDNDKWGNSKWLCQCNCPNKNQIIVLGSNLQSNHTQSCGCLWKEIASACHTKHGHRNDKIYAIWAAMIQRCTNPNNKQQKNYGGRGITVCEEWLKFPNFFADMGKQPKGYTIERIDNNKGYYKDNCTWTTPQKQARNRRNNLRVTHNGKTQLLVEWSEETKIPYKTLYARIYRYDWSIEKTLTTPVVLKKRNWRHV